MTKKTNPTGVRYPMTRAWKALVVDRMVARNLSRAELARQLGVTRGALTQFFGVGMERKRAGVVELRLLLAELREHEPEKYAVILRLLARLLRSAKLSVDVKRGV